MRGNLRDTDNKVEVTDSKHSLIRCGCCANDDREGNDLDNLMSWVWRETVYKVEIDSLVQLAQLGAGWLELLEARGGLEKI